MSNINGIFTTGRRIANNIFKVLFKVQWNTIENDSCDSFIEFSTADSYNFWLLILEELDDLEFGLFLTNFPVSLLAVG
jgi:hypothetical protein